ncbi:hypothetical protein ACFZAU_14840 [Streptomyces sp. NPDC008238]
MPGTASPEHARRDANGTRRPLAPAERGVTVIPDRVVARIAARAAGTALQRLNHPLEHLAATDARATRHGGAASLALSVDLPYPTDIAATCQQLQREISERVARLTGLDISAVTLTIRRLTTTGRPLRVK